MTEREILCKVSRIQGLAEGLSEGMRCFGPSPRQTEAVLPVLDEIIKLSAHVRFEMGGGFDGTPDDAP